MADRIETFHVVEPAGGSPANFTSTRVTFDPGVVTAVIVHMPSGHRGVCGIQIAYGGYQIIPSPPRVYYRGNKRTIRRELSDVFPANGDWWVQTFNSGRYPHAFEVEFEVDAVTQDALGGPFVLFIPAGGAADTGFVAGGTGGAVSTGTGGGGTTATPV